MSEPKGQILSESKFGKKLTGLAVEAETILEIGTWHGLGSTKCLADGMVRSTQRMWTIEADPTMWAEAKSYYSDDRITFINAHALNVIDQLPGHFDLVLFDGCDIQTDNEFDALKDRLTVACFDDTNERKNRRQRETVLNSDEWITTDDHLNDRLGWTVARKANEFDAIYRSGGWDGKGSGPGSTELFTRKFRDELAKYLNTEGIYSIFDYGCGDWSWQKHMARHFGKYIGWDKSYLAVQAAKKVAPVSPNFEFHVGDPFLTPSRIKPCDLLIIKDVLHHVGKVDAARIMDFAKTFPKVLLVADTDESGAIVSMPASCDFKWREIYRFDTSVDGYQYGPKSAFVFQ